MTLDYQAFAFWLDAAQWASIVGVGVWGHLRARDDANARQIKAVADRLQLLDQSCTAQHSEHALRVTRLEERVQHMPTDEDLTIVAGEVKQVAERVEGMENLLRRIEHQTNLIHQHLLSAAR